jgi:hypothetical protein
MKSLQDWDNSKCHEEEMNHEQPKYRKYVLERCIPENMIGEPDRYHEENEKHDYAK